MGKEITITYTAAFQLVAVYTYMEGQIPVEIFLS